MTPATLSFKIKITITGGMVYNRGPYTIDLMCGKTTGGVVTTKVTISEPTTFKST